MIEPRCDRENLARGPFKDLRRRSAVFGRILQQLGREPLPEFSLPGIFPGQALDPFHYQLRRPACEIEHEFGCHLEVAARFAARFPTQLFSP